MSKELQLNKNTNVRVYQGVVTITQVDEKLDRVDKITLSKEDIKKLIASI